MGGAVFAGASATLYVDTLFDSNYTSASGGAVGLCGTDASRFLNCEFRNGRAQDLGGAVLAYDSSIPRFSKVVFSRNMAGGQLGAQQAPDFAFGVTPDAATATQQFLTLVVTDCPLDIA